MKPKLLKKSRAVYSSAFYRSGAKDAIRGLVIKSHEDPKMALMLGGKDLWDVKFLLGTHKQCRVISVERDPLIFRSQCKKAKDFPGVTPYFGEVSNFLSGMNNWMPFDIAFLDYQGTLSVSIEEDLQKMFQSHNLNRGATVALTLTGAREKRSIMRTYCFQSVCQKSLVMYRQDRLGVIAHMVMSIAQNNGHSLKLLKAFKYGLRTPMLFWMFRVV